MPSNPYEAKGLLVEAIRDDDPVMYMEHKFMYDDKGEVPDDSYSIPFGEARYSRDGGDITVCALGRMVNLCNQVADELEKENIYCTVIDLRCTSPLDKESICESVEETGRLVVVDEGYPRCGFASDVAALAAVHVQPALRAPGKAGDTASYHHTFCARARGTLYPECRQDQTRHQGSVGSITYG